jgi:acyl carrier protein
MAHTNPPTPDVAEERDVLHGVAELFREILGLDGEPDPDSDFFEAGGNSILGARLVVMLRRTFGVKVTIRDVFRARTVAAVAAVIGERR